MIYLVRHGESQANAGERATGGDNETGLTEKGTLQAQNFADNFNIKPDLIVHSPYFRAKQTAMPLMAKFPDVPVEVWDVQEFTFLDKDICRGTTREERLVIAEEYYSQNDLDFVHGNGAESFNQMVKRVDDMLAKLKCIDKDKFVVIFTHGNFIKTTLMRLNNMPIDFETYFSMRPIDNLEIVEIKGEF